MKERTWFVAGGYTIDPDPDAEPLVPGDSVTVTDRAAVETWAEARGYEYVTVTVYDRDPNLPDAEELDHLTYTPEYGWAVAR